MAFRHLEEQGGATARVHSVFHPAVINVRKACFTPSTGLPHHTPPHLTPSHHLQPLSQLVGCGVFSQPCRAEAREVN